MGAQLPLLDDAEQVGLDLARLGEKRALQPGFGSKEKRVDVGRHVAGRAGVGVVAPGAADLAGALEDREGVDAGAASADRGADAGEARADDRDGEIPGHGRGSFRGAPAERTSGAPDARGSGRAARDRVGALSSERERHPRHGWHARLRARRGRGGRAGLPRALGARACSACASSPGFDSAATSSRPALDRAHRARCATSRHGYYGRWLASLERPAAGRSACCSPASSRRASPAARPPPRRARALPPPRAPAPAHAFVRGVERAPAFSLGDGVRTRNHQPAGHTRLPALRALACGASSHASTRRCVFPDTNAHGLGEEPQHLYTVRFASSELWGDGRRARDAVVHLDLFEPYLEAAPSHEPPRSRTTATIRRRASRCASKRSRRCWSRRGSSTRPHVDAIVRRYEEDVGPMNGARVVARAWVDPDYRRRLLADGDRRHRGARLRRARRASTWSCVENTPERAQRRRLHALLLLPVAGPRAAAGLVQVARVPLARRARAARGARARWASSCRPRSRSASGTRAAEVRYLVLPERPAGTEGLVARRQLRGALVTRDAMIGVARGEALRRRDGGRGGCTGPRRRRARPRRRAGTASSSSRRRGRAASSA